VTSQVERPYRRRKVSPEMLGEIVVSRGVTCGAMHQNQRVLGIGVLVASEEKRLAFTARNAPVDRGLKRDISVDGGHGAGCSVP
jgi:hypothetical protein